jgi:hypothetical protein
MGVTPRRGTLPVLDSQKTAAAKSLNAALQPKKQPVEQPVGVDQGVLVVDLVTQPYPAQDKTPRFAGSSDEP